MIRSSFRTRAFPRKLGLACAVFIILSFLQTPAQGQNRPGLGIDLRKMDPSTVRAMDSADLPPIEETCGLTATAYKGTSVTLSSSDPSKRSEQTATFVVDYGPGFQQNPAARAAFQRAVDTWATHIRSDATIRISASFGDLGPRVLGGARPAYAVGEIDGDSLVVAIDLLEAINGQALEDLNPMSTRTSSDPEIFAQFNSERTDWNYDEGPAAPNEIDFETVVLHEIGHGLQFASTFSYNASAGGSTCNGQAGTACYGFGTGFPSTYDRQAVLFQSASETEDFLIDFPNPSVELADAVQVTASEFATEQVRFTGPSATATGLIDNGPQPPILYFPSPWQPGSSGSHVNEATYPPSSADALMTPDFGLGETTRLPGPVVCGILDDMGWPLGNDCLRYIRDPLSFQLTSRDIVGGNATLEWVVTDDTDVDSYTVLRRFFDGAFEPVASLPGSTDPSFTDSNLGLGQYTYRLDFTRPDGSTGTVSERPRFTISISQVEASISSQDSDASRADVLVEWDVPPGTEGFTYIVERRRGSGASDPFEVATQTSGTEFVDQDLFPGAYGYQIRAVTNSQNEVGSVTAEVEVSTEEEVFISGPNPNPVSQGRPQATLFVTSQTRQDATVVVYNTLGQRLFTVDVPLRRDAATPIGIPTRELSSGMYFVQIRAEEFTTTRQMVVTR